MDHIPSLPPSLGLCPPPWDQSLSRTDGLIIRTVKLVNREVPDKRIITIIIIISELGIKEIKMPQLGGGCSFPRPCHLP